MPSTQAILITCGDNHFADGNGFSESKIRAAIGHEVAFYEVRCAGGAGVVLRSETAVAFMTEELMTFIGGPITERQAQEGNVDEVIVIGTVHRSCGGCKAHIGDLFETDAELMALQNILIEQFGTVVDSLQYQTGFNIRGIGLILDHFGSPNGEPIDFQEIAEQAMVGA